MIHRVVLTGFHAEIMQFQGAAGQVLPYLLLISSECVLVYSCDDDGIGSCGARTTTHYICI